MIAGGQSLVPMMMLHFAAPSALIDIGGVDERTIELGDDGTLVLSALVRHADLEHSDVVAEHVPMLTQAVRQIGNVRVRHRGTIGGSLAHGEPAAELPCVLIAHGAIVHALGPDGERTIAVDDLPVMQLMTSLGDGELITRVEVPDAHRRARARASSRWRRRPGDFAMVNVAALVTCDDEGTCTAVRLVLGAVGQRPVDVSAAAQALVGHAIDEESSEAVAAAVAAEAEVDPELARRRRLPARDGRGAGGPGAARRVRGRAAAPQRDHGGAHDRDLAGSSSASPINGRPTDFGVSAEPVAARAAAHRGRRPRGQARVRRGRVRDLHRPARRRAGQRLPDVRGAGRRL